MPLGTMEPPLMAELTGVPLAPFIFSPPAGWSAASAWVPASADRNRPHASIFFIFPSFIPFSLS